MKAVCGVVTLVLALSGCASGPLTTRERTTLGGAALGAGTGALIGAASGGKAGIGALIGGGIGALSGALLGDQLQKVERERGVAAYPPRPAVGQAHASTRAGGLPQTPRQGVASRSSGDPTRGEFINGTPWIVRVYVDPNPNNVEATTPVVLAPNQVVPWNLDIGTHRTIARAYVNTQFGERLVGRFDRTIQIESRRPGWFLKLEASSFR
ncbi:MAG: glycine zipper domain-containing protein [Candidatus Methylomirabilia bacterium]